MSAPTRQTPEERLTAFEAMLSAVEAQYADTAAQMEKLKAAGRVKSATYRQLFAKKLNLQDMLTFYEVYGLRKAAVRTQRAKTKTARKSRLPGCFIDKKRMGPARWLRPCRPAQGRRGGGGGFT